VLRQTFSGRMSKIWYVLCISIAGCIRICVVGSKPNAMFDLANDSGIVQRLIKMRISDVMSRTCGAL
jgi:hypothetical protein